MIAHVSPATIHRDESRNTLIYADRANRISNKVERNVLDVSYHVSQYRDIISDLKNEISRLRTKMTDDRPRFDEVKTNPRGSDFKTLREKIVSVFKEQMRLRYINFIYTHSFYQFRPWTQGFSINKQTLPSIFIDRLIFFSLIETYF